MRNDARPPFCLLRALWLVLMGVIAAAGAPQVPTGGSFRVANGDVPLNLIETPDGSVVSLNSGYGIPYLQAYDEVHRQVRGRLEAKSLWYGLDYGSAQKALLASSGNDWVYEIPWNGGKFGEPRKIDLPGCELTAGVTWLDAGSAVVACNLNHRAVKFEVASGKVLASAETGEYPYAVAVVPGGRLAVSNWGQSSVSVFNAADLRPVRTIPVGSHPNAMLVLARSHQLLVACSDSDSVSVIDLPTLREVRRLDLHIPGSTLGGAQPDALAFDAHRGKLYVALAQINALGVFSLPLGHDGADELRFEGVVPIGSYPTGLTYSPRTRTLFITDGRNRVTGPSDPNSQHHEAGCPSHSDSGSPINYIGCLVGGGIEAISDAAMAGLGEKMTTLAVQVYGSKRAVVSPEGAARIEHFSSHRGKPGPIRHVIYVIKENRTYDQVLGDISEGNGDSNITLFGESVTPNQHALSRQYILFDNFYVDGDVSADGHLWSTAAESTDYVNKLWPAAYSHKLLHYNIWGPDYNGDEKHDRPIAAPHSGYLWDAAENAGISYRDYGERCDTDASDPQRVVAYLRGLKGHYDPLFNPGIGVVTDQVRMDEFEREFRGFEQNNNLPELVIMDIPNDHTVGTRPDHFTPRAMMADNDLAVGRLVDLVSHSRFWASTVIFVLEDDAQDGPDHVDAHRSPLYVLSPYTQIHQVEHARFSTVSVLKAIEQILGLPSLTYFDDRAPSLLAEFAEQGSFQPYTAVQPSTPLDEKNLPSAPGAKESARWDFTHPDEAPEMELNRVIWKSVKGAGSEPPASVFSVQARYGR